MSSSLMGIEGFFRAVSFGAAAAAVALLLPLGFLLLNIRLKIKRKKIFNNLIVFFFFNSSSKRAHRNEPIENAEYIEATCG